MLLALARTAHAEPPPPSKLGFRLGFGRVPIADAVLATSQVAIGVEHPIVDKLRIAAEYEWLWIGEVPRDPEMEMSHTGMGHRTHLGFRHAFASKRVHVIRFYADVEAGGGLGLYDTPTDSGVMPHGFVGLRAGYSVTMRSSRDAQVLETELHFRAIVVEHGVGFGGGLGFYWGN